jgi:ribosomal protein L9
MEIVMKEGYELTEEILKISRGYDRNYLYIDNYGQMKNAEENNEMIKNKLRELNVEKLDGFPL